ncbi:methylation-associated defense system restriction endonuclease subunit S MAD5 (plasmid) [Cereibacter azotoformans]|uniref:methylation-associated defense system restriction endonuclease subunit S MAD5 n=1 Tax=Cereibacter azotoformans TaxID=43057 RepID=UPI003B226030
MSRKFQVKSVPSTWLENNGRRLDCGPYLSGAIEARELLRKLPAEKTRLANLTVGIFHAGRESRQWVEAEEFGVRFMGSTDVLAADLSGLPLISKKQVRANPNFTIRAGWTLITRSGTIGRMAYARSDMNGVACSEHVMRVAPDEQKIKPGYLYAYLNSRFGVPLVVSGTYGAIIQHIEPHHISDLPVPRLGELEEHVHSLIEYAAEKRVAANNLIDTAIANMATAAGLPELPASDGVPFGFNAVSSARLVHRMDGAFHSHHHDEAVSLLKEAKAPPTSISKMCRSVVEPNRFKRILIDDPTFGVPLFGTSALMWADPKPSYLIPKNMTGIDGLLVGRSTVLVPRSGQIAGIIGTPVLPYGELIGGAVSEDAIRINCPDENVAGYVFVALKSEYGRRQLKARAYGSSIPHLDVNQIKSVQVPNLGTQLIEEIGSLGVQSAKLRHEAITCENQARELVENAIEAGRH